MNIPRFVYSFTCGWTFGCFQCLAIMNNGWNALCGEICSIPDLVSPLATASTSVDVVL